MWTHTCNSSVRDTVPSKQTAHTKRMVSITGGVGKREVGTEGVGGGAGTEGEGVGK